MLRLAALITIAFLALSPTHAQVSVPSFWDDGERAAKPDLAAFTRVRFLTTVDFAPFNSLDVNGQLVGFNIDLARAICGKLDIMPICEIQAVPWVELSNALAGGEAEAAIAGIAITPETRETLIFTRPYLRFPARFIVRNGFEAEAGVAGALAGKRVGAIAGSAHLAMLRAEFAEIQTVTYQRQDWMLRDLAEGKLDAVFGDGARLSFWLAGEQGSACCAFAGGPYLHAGYLGDGLAIAATPTNAVLIEAFDWAMKELAVDGGYADLYLRHFPVSFY